MESSWSTVTLRTVTLLKLLNVQKRNTKAQLLPASASYTKQSWLLACSPVVADQKGGKLTVSGILSHMKMLAYGFCSQASWPPSLHSTMNSIDWKACRLSDRGVPKNTEFPNMNYSNRNNLNLFAGCVLTSASWNALCFHGKAYDTSYLWFYIQPYKIQWGTLLDCR